MVVQRRLAFVLAAGLIAAPDAMAVQQAKSRYSTIDLAKCRSVAGRGGVKGWLCAGLPGYPIYVATDATRTYFSVGPNASGRRAAFQSLPVANSLFDGRSRRTAVEWRFIIRDKQAVPYATIVRYFTQHGGRRGEVVIVTRVGEAESCQVARIDALATADAMVLARQIADQTARRFDCAAPPQVAGDVGRSPM